MRTREAVGSWRDYRLGIAVVVICNIVVLFVILLGSSRGPLAPDFYTLYLRLDDAAGIRVGSPVTVSGLAAGEVSDVVIVAPRQRSAIAPGGILPPAPGAGAVHEGRNIQLTLRVQERYRPNITGSSTAVLANLGLGGERYVKIRSGDIREPALNDGDTLTAAPVFDWDLAAARVSRALNEAQDIFRLTAELKSHFSGGDKQLGTIGKLMVEGSVLKNQAEQLGTAAQRIFASIESGDGFIAHYRSDPLLRQRIEQLSADIRAIKAARDDPESGLNKWAGATALREAVGDAGRESKALRADLDAGRGTAGRLMNDRELQRQLGVLAQKIDALMAAFRANPMGFVKITLF